MNIACYEEKSFRTSLGEVFIEGPVKAAVLKNFYMSEGLTNFRPPAKQKEALISISNTREGMIYVARHGREIIGYITFHAADQYSRWSKHPQVLELGCIEISPYFRKCRLGSVLLKEAFSNPMLDNYIVVTIEFCWHWDLKESRLEMYEYREMLTKFFGAIGLEKRATDDPDITEHPANVLMARIGKNVKQNDVMFFENMLFEKKMV